MNRSPIPNEITPRSIAVDCVADLKLEIGESPAWSVSEQCLYLVDIGCAKLIRVSPEKLAAETLELARMATAVAPSSSGGLVMADERGFSTYDWGSDMRSPLASLDEPAGNRLNDGKCDRNGRFWAGSMSGTVWEAPVGALYRIDGSGKVARMLDGIRCSNGLGWSPDGRTFYFAESFAHCVHAFDYDSEAGVLSNQRPFALLDPASGAFPDGLAVDAEGCVWSAQPVYGRLVRYAPNGNIERIVDMPVSRPTSCAFGGEKLDTLFVTSARNSLSSSELEEEPLAGGLFAFRPGVQGLAEAPFRI